jgi:hypothetical protein
MMPNAIICKMLYKHIPPSYYHLDIVSLVFLLDSWFIIVGLVFLIDTVVSSLASPSLCHLLTRPSIIRNIYHHHKMQKLVVVKSKNCCQ